MKIDVTTQFWRSKKLSVRASNCLSKANISNEQELIQQFTTFDSVIALRNCGRKTAEEIWQFLINLKPVPNFDQESEIKLSNNNEHLTKIQRNYLKLLNTNKKKSNNNEHLTKIQRIFIPLLNTKVSARTWEVLEKTSVNSIPWSVRTGNVINQQGLLQLADLCQFSSREWLRFRNFGRTSLIELQERMTEIVEHLADLPDPSDEPSPPNPDHFVEILSVFVPLLNTKVSARTWEVLEKTSVNSIPWSVRTRNVISQQGLLQLADLCQFSSREWLRFRNFGRTSLIELQERMTETVEHLSNIPPPSDEPSPLNPEHFVEILSIFVPLLNTKVSGHTWIALQNRSIHQLTWSVRTKNILLTQNFKTLAEIAELSPKQWLKFRNFGRKSLTEIQETVNRVIAHPDVLDPKTEQSVEVSQIQTLTKLGQVIFQRLQIRQQEVLKYYYGYDEKRKKLQQIGEVLGVTRERVRQIKKTVNIKINQGVDNYLITTTLFRLLGKSICDILSQHDGFCAVEKLHEILRQRLGWKNSEQWIINWFNEAFGEGWICLGADEYKIVNDVCHLKSAEVIQSFLKELATRLQRYGYRPLTLEECQNLIKKTDRPIYNSGYLLNMIASYPSLKVYQYGKTRIGLKAWTWFNPEKPMTLAGRASLIEWYLRMTNEPATPKAIANGIEAQLGNFRLSPFDIADICEKQRYRFQIYDHDAYGLSLWEESEKYQQALTELLSDKPLMIEQIAEKMLSVQEPTDTMRIVVALNFSDSFVETAPFAWTLKPQKDMMKTKDDFDYTKLSFEDLIPKS